MFLHLESRRRHRVSGINTGSLLEMNADEGADDERASKWTTDKCDKQQQVVETSSSADSAAVVLKSSSATTKPRTSEFSLDDIFTTVCEHQ